MDDQVIKCSNEQCQKIIQSNFLVVDLDDLGSIPFCSQQCKGIWINSRTRTVKYSFYPENSESIL